MSPDPYLLLIPNIPEALFTQQAQHLCPATGDLSFGSEGPGAAASGTGGPDSDHRLYAGGARHLLEAGGYTPGVSAQCPGGSRVASRVTACREHREGPPDTPPPTADQPEPGRVGFTLQPGAGGRGPSPARGSAGPRAGRSEPLGRMAEQRAHLGRWAAHNHRRLSRLPPA